MPDSTPTIDVNGKTVQLRSKSDVLTVFEQQAGFTVGDQIEEWNITTIDPELDYNTAEQKHILRCYVYFEPLEAVNTGVASETLLSVEGWSREKNLLEENKIGIIYERYL